MRQLLDDVKRKLTDLQFAGGEEWKTLKSNTEKRLDDLKKRGDEFKAKYL